MTLDSQIATKEDLLRVRKMAETLDMSDKWIAALRVYQPQQEQTVLEETKLRPDHEPEVLLDVENTKKQETAVSASEAVVTNEPPHQPEATAPEHKGWQTQVLFWFLLLLSFCCVVGWLL